MKKLIILLALGAVALTGLQSRAMAGLNDGYDPMYWNGPAGSSDYNILFTGPEETGLLMRLLSSHKNRATRACSSYSRKYLRTGRRRWLRKYKICLADHS